MRARGAKAALAACSRLENETEHDSQSTSVESEERSRRKHGFWRCIHCPLIGSKQDLPSHLPAQSKPELPQPASALTMEDITSCHDCSEKWKMGHHQRPLAHHEAQFEMSTFQPLCRTLILKACRPQGCVRSVRLAFEDGDISILS